MLCLYYPQQLLPGLAAVQQFRHHRGRTPHAPLTLLVWSPPATDQAARAKRRQAFEVLLEPFPWVELVFPDAKEVEANLSQHARVADKAGYLRRRFNGRSFDAIYYAHDISADFIAQSAMQAFPAAERVCFGDALGIVYRNAFFTDQIYPLGPLSDILGRPGRTLRHLAFRLKRAWTLPAPWRRLDAHCAALILPCDPGGDFLTDKVLLPVEFETVRQVLSRLSSAVERHLAGPPTAIDEAASIMLLGSFSESCLMSEAQEYALYEEVANRHVIAGSRLGLKPHPASPRTKVERLTSVLASRYQIEVMNHDEFPVEAMPWLAANKQVLSFSYSSVSLRYLYGTKVKHVLTDELIERYFPLEARGWMRDSNQLYLEQVAVAERAREQLTRGRPCPE